MTALASIQSALDPAGPQAARIGHLWWLLFGVCALVYLLVLVFTGIAVFGAGTTYIGRESKFRRHVATAVGATAVVLLVFLVASAATGNAVSSLPPEHALVVEVIGHQWWWEIHYPNADPSQSVITANEFHIPTARPVMIRATADDVIHSLWIPNLQGKRDLIPSKWTVNWIQADRPGTYRGQCAEYCGLQHAHMAIYAVAESPEQFNAWLDNQRKPARGVSDPELEKGQQVFMAQPCVMCHTIQGTDAAGQVAPDLTHLASRMTIAAGALPNNIGNLGGWITDSQNVKPGNHMPPVTIRPEDLQPLLKYLASLQ